MIAVTTQIIPGQINEHNVFGIFFWIAQKFFSQTIILGIVSCAAKRSCNGINSGLAIFYYDLSFGRGPKDSKTSVIKVKQVRGGIYRAQASVYIEVIAIVLTGK